MTDAEQREAARQFVNRWIGKGKEDEDGRSYWIDLLSNVLGMDNITERLNFEKKVVVDGNTKRIDVYIPETRVIIEQKSLGKALDHKIRNSGEINLTPFEQADRYNSKLTFDERARWIVTSNFAEIWIYDMNQKQPEPTKIALDELQSKYPLLDFLIKKEVKTISHEMEVSIKAGDIVGLIYDAFLKQYRIPDIKEKDETPAQKEKREHKLKSLNALCVRIVFCLYAEDAGILGKRNMFHDFLAAYEVKDCRRALIELFKILDTPVAERDEYLEDDLAQFPYVNGGLFADESIEIPQFTEEIKELLLTKASEDFNWREISPTIFGAVFESTLNPETRRSGGMHYTSIENIHKVIDPLFLEDLQNEFNDIQRILVKRTRDRKLDEFQDKLASLSFLDPACGSGNFLTETYLSLRRLENKVIREKVNGQMTLGEVTNPIKVSIQQFYGIEINDFAATVAKTALWIAESQMLEETKSIIYGFNDDFLPLKTYVNITEGNALRVDWNDVIPVNQLSYIMGNPPFVGARWMSKAQKKDMELVFQGIKDFGNLDFVTAWYKKASDYIQNTNVFVAFVSTNTITQGEQPAIFWKPLFDMGIHINYAYRTFQWDSEANLKAHVHCVIVGFSYAASNKKKLIYEANGDFKIARNINAYLIDSDDIFVGRRKHPLCDVPEIGIGNKPIDGGYYLFDKEEMEEFIQQEPKSKQYFHPWYGAREFINQNPRYCLYLGDCSPKELREMPECMKRVNAVREYRLQSTSAGTRKIADVPTRFHVSNFPKGSYIVIPQVSSERRRYIPMGYMDESVLCSDKVRIMPMGTLYHFGVLESNVHMAWMRAICGRLKSDYSYTVNHVYNNFPWPKLSEKQKQRIEQTAQGILDARSLFPYNSLADLYDPLTMPPELRRAHMMNDKAVMDAYGFSTKMTEEDCVSELMKLYKKMS
ncbi:MAG: N-6 DNA methylase [Eubacteriales bacterium]|nr:N-6 DNA methylase [Eubacteriales bacterium]